MKKKSLGIPSASCVLLVGESEGLLSKGSSSNGNCWNRFGRKMFREITFEGKKGFECLLIIKRGKHFFREFGKWGERKLFNSLCDMK
jgi:hypothetical protein